jgi:6-phosphogluconolactonase (cycloisomerase 2 family)
MTNDAAANEVLVFMRAADGSLTTGPRYATGGRGTAGSLGNQGGLILSPNEQWLFAVNAGSDTITSFLVLNDGLQKTGEFPSRGSRPVSLAMHDNLLYVVNAGSDEIQGFTVEQGALRVLPESRKSLSGAGTAPAQILFSTEGDALLVTEKATNNIVIFDIGLSGRPLRMRVTPSNGGTPFGFTAGPRNQIFVSEAFGGSPNASALSSYRLTAAGGLRSISSSVGTTQTAACWVVLADGGRLAFVSNTASASISSYRVGFNGNVALINPQAAMTGNSPIDMAVSNNGRFLYVLNQASGTIGDYAIGLNGSLVSIPGGVQGLPPGANGLAAR